jgi:hypothetical protein
MFVKAGQFLCKQLVKNMWNSEKGSPMPHDFHVAVFFKRERARNFESRNDNEKNSLMFRYTCLMFWGVPVEPGCFAAARGWETFKASFCPLASMIWQISGDY